MVVEILALKNIKNLRYKRCLLKFSKTPTFSGIKLILVKNAIEKGE